MSPSRLRTWLRWSHVVTGLVIGAYVCSPLHAEAWATAVARLSLLPVIALTGLAMWRQASLVRFLGGRAGVTTRPGVGG